MRSNRLGPIRLFIAGRSFQNNIALDNPEVLCMMRTPMAAVRLTSAMICSAPSVLTTPRRPQGPECMTAIGMLVS